MSHEQELEEAAQAAVGDEPVVAAGWFEPFGRALADGNLMGIAAGHSLVMDGIGAALGGTALGVQHAKSGPMPLALVLAVTASKLYAFEGDPMLPTAKIGAQWHVWDRDALHVHSHKIAFMLLLTLEDPASGRVYQLQGSKLHEAGPKHVAQALLG